MGVYIFFILFEDLPLLMTLSGLAGHLSYLYVMRTFPFFYFTSIPFLSSLFFIVLNHYLAFSHFSTHYYPFIQVNKHFLLHVSFEYKL